MLLPGLFWAPQGKVPQLVLVDRQGLELAASPSLELEVLRAHQDAAERIASFRKCTVRLPVRDINTDDRGVLKCL